MSRTDARRAIQTIKAPVPTAEKTLNVTAESIPVLKMDDLEYVRSMVARYCLRVAMELGCSKIVIHHPTRGAIPFDVVDVLKDTVRRIGYWPVPAMKRVPTNIATMGFTRVHGAEVSRVRGYVPVPSGFPVSPARQGA